MNLKTQEAFHQVKIIPLLEDPFQGHQQQKVIVKVNIKYRFHILFIERNLSSSNKYRKQKKTDESIEEEKSMNWPKQFVDINDIMDNNYPLQNELDHDEELYTDIKKLKNKNEVHKKPITA